MCGINAIGFVVTLCVFVASIKCENGANVQGPSLFCSDLNPQQSIDISQFLGMWIAHEIITHHDTLHREVTYNSCVTIHLSDITDSFPTNNRRQDFQFDRYHDRQMVPFDANIPRPTGSHFYHYLRLIWNEQDLSNEYTLRYNTSRPGFWISSAPQKGTMIGINYDQFTGTVQVMKVIGRHMVLTFCENLPGSQLFTVILTRSQQSVTTDDLQSIHSMLNRRGLSTISVRKVCSGTESLTASVIVLSIAAILALLKQ